MADKELEGACTLHDSRYDSNNERNAALGLLAKLGFAGSYVVGGSRLDSKSDAYLTVYAVEKSRQASDQARFDAFHQTDVSENTEHIDHGDGEPSAAEMFMRRQAVLPIARANVQRNHHDASQPSAQEIANECDRLVAANPKLGRKVETYRVATPSAHHDEDQKRTAIESAKRFIKPIKDPQGGLL